MSDIQISTGTMMRISEPARDNIAAESGSPCLPARFF